MSRTLHTNARWHPRRISAALTAVVFGGGVILSVAGPPAHAQSLPGSVDAGRIPNQINKPAPKKPELQLELPGPKEAPAPEAAKAVVFKLTGVNIVGATVFSPDSLAAMYQDRIGKQISLAEVYSWAEAITLKYRDAGYVLSRAFVPAQTIGAGGTVRIRVVEGFISAVTIQGDSSPLLESYAQKLIASKPLNSRDLERYLLLANELPGFSVQTVLAASKTVPGGSDLTLISTLKPYDAILESDNRGTKFIGPYQGYASAGENDFFGYNERLSMQYATVSTLHELSFLGINGQLPLDDDGTVLNVSGTRTRAKPGFTLSMLDARTLGDGFIVGVSHAVLRQRSQDISVGLNFEYRNSKSVLNNNPDAVPSSNDKIRALRLNGTYDLLDTLGGQNSVAAEFSHGLPILGASREDRPNPSRPDGLTKFDKLTLSLSRLQDLGNSFALLTAFTGQTAFGKPLLSSEQFGVGGGQFGRGYDSSEITGDDGYALKAELQWNTTIDLLAQRVVQFYTFYDFGEVFKNYVTPGTEQSQSLASAGFGARFSLLDNVSTTLEAARPLTRPVATAIDHSDPKDWRFYFSVTTSF